MFSTNRPINSINEKLNNRDITISIVIGDFFEQKGEYIVGTNTTFDTNLNEGIVFNNSILLNRQRFSRSIVWVSSQEGESFDNFSSKS